MSPSSHHRELILASGSPYRAELLKRLAVPFRTQAPDIDERTRSGENAAELTARLAQAKAEAVSADHPAAVVIGSDQVAAFRDRIIGKPGTADGAEAQLLEFSHRTVRFVTAVAVHCIEADLALHDTVVTEVRFRRLDAESVRRYIALDRPLDCAGAFKSESAGPMLLEAMRSDDPTAIIGLPLIALAGMLRRAGFAMP